MVVICLVGTKRGVKCIHKRNSKTPQGIDCGYCGIDADKAQCVFSQEVPQWTKSKGVFELEEIA